MYCPNCGKEIKEDGRFCSECGHNVSIVKGNQDNDKEKISVQLINEIKEDFKQPVRNVSGINNFRRFINSYKYDGVFRESITDSARKIRNYLVLGVVGICVIVGGVKVYGSYKHKKYEEKRNTFLEDSFVIDKASFKTIHLDYRGAEWFKNLEIKAEDISGQYEANPYGKIKNIELNLKLESLPDEVEIEDISIVYRDTYDNSIIGLKGFECIFDNDTDTIKFIGTSPSTKSGYNLSLDNIMRLRVYADLKGIGYSSRNNTDIYIDLGPIIIK